MRQKGVFASLNRPLYVGVMSGGSDVYPRAGVDYPATLVEFEQFFADDEACWKYLERLRWPDGFICLRCRRPGRAWRTKRGLLICSLCRRQVSITAGTIFEGTRKPLRQWFLAAWEVTSQKYGASALGIQRILGLKSYQTAWAWLHKLRRAMVRPDRDRLVGEVEVDEAYVGGEEAGVRGRETVKKAIVVIAVELKNSRVGRIRLRHVADLSAKSLVGFVAEVVEACSTVKTDGWPSYGGLSKKGFEHQVTILSASADAAHVEMPHVHRVASLLKRWWLGTHQGAISSEHLAYYLDEFTFRFNRRTSRSRGLLFYRLLRQAAQTEHVPTTALYASTGRGPRAGTRTTPNM